MNATVEMVFLLYRCVLPVPVWMQFYAQNGGYLAPLYLVLKVRLTFLCALISICFLINLPVNIMLHT